MSEKTSKGAQNPAAAGRQQQLPPTAENYRERATTVGELADKAQSPDWMQALENAYSMHEPDTPSDEEIEWLTGEIEGRVDSEQVAALLASCRDSVVQNIVEPFGLRGVFANRDKHGGRVLTRRNAAEKFHGRDDQIYEPEDANYKNSKQDYGLKKGVREQMRAENAVDCGEVKDAYTGKSIPVNEADVDHVVSKKEFHYAEGGFMLDADQRSAFANDPDNLALTDQSVNRSKGSDSIPDIKERKPEVDRRRTRHTEKRAQQAVTGHRPSAAQAARYYAKKVAPEAAGSALRLGMRQALGLCLHELTIGIFDEVTDICRNGLRADETSYVHAVGKRLAEIWRRVREKWQDMLSAFRDGVVAGALSEVVTLLVNLVSATSKRVVRIVREGALSFLRALKMIVVLPEGMTRAEALDAATKAMAGAVLTGCGIALEEMIERALGALPLAELVVPVVLGILVSLATAVVVFCLDRLDMFAVQENLRREYLFAELDARVEKALGAIEYAPGGLISSP